MSDDILMRVRGCYGAVRVRDLHLDRTEYRQVSRLIGSGDLSEHEHGVVSIPGTERDLVIARIHGGALTCHSAAKYHGLPTFKAPHHAHLAVPKGSRISPVGREVLHEERSMEPPSPTEFPVAPVAEALARYLRCDDGKEAPVAACDAAFHAALTTTEQVAALLHGRGAPRARARLALTSDRARSPLESLARLQLHDAGIPYVDGVIIEGVGEVDLVVHGWLVVELDGYTYHEDEVQFGLDRWRDRRLLTRGFRTMRFTRQDVQAGVIAEEVDKVLMARRDEPKDFCAEPAS